MANEEFRISCLVPARNEEGHLEPLIDSISRNDLIAEIILIEGGSSDNTWNEVLRLREKFPAKIIAIQQTGSGKFDAVLQGARQAKFPFILIWDADGTVSEKDTSAIIQLAKRERVAVVGDRLRGLMEPGAMQKANKIGNWLFAIAWSFILRRKPADMLCGTKIFPRKVFIDIPDSYVNKDPFGDFALILNARRLKVDVESYVVDYSARRYGSTNIKRWRAGIQLLKMTFFAYFEFAFKMTSGIS